MVGDRDLRPPELLEDTMSDFTGTRYVEVDSEQAGTPEYVSWLEQRVEGLEDEHNDRLQLLEAIRFAVDRLPETPANVPVRAKLEMALTDLVVAEETT